MAFKEANGGDTQRFLGCRPLRLPLDSMHPPPRSSLIKQAALPALLAICVAGLFWQDRVNRRLHGELDQLHATLERQSAELKRTQRASAAQEQRIQADLERLKAQVSALPASPAGVSKDNWLERVQVLRRLFAQSPALSIPELQFATEEDWLDAARKPIITEDDYRRAMARLRDSSITHFAPQLHTALKQFAMDNSNAFPNDIAQLKKYLPSLADDALLNRYKIAPDNELSVHVGGGNGFSITQVGPVDEDFDSQFVIGVDGYGCTPYSAERIRAIVEALGPAYRKAHPDVPIRSAADLLPFATTAEQRTVLERQLQQEQKPSE